jgi:tRNA(fMet)-specific endonuclease VapC
MLDTNAVSDAVKRPAGPVARRLVQLLPGQAVISVVVEGELRYGIAKASATMIERRVNALLAHVPILGITSEVARLHGRVRADLERKGILIGANDLWIAAHALERGLTVITDNVAEFERVPGLTVENWRTENGHGPGADQNRSSVTSETACSSSHPPP